MTEKKLKRKTKNVRVIPGFGLSLGITLTVLSFVVIIPLAYKRY